MDTRTRRAARQYEPDDDDALYETRQPTSTRRYTTTQQRAMARQRPRDVVRYHGEYDYHTQTRRATQRTHTRETEEHYTPTRRNPLVYIGIGGVGVILIIFIVSSIMSWWRIYQDDQHYGRPRTFQVDAAVGHNQDSPARPSHFVAINLHRHVIIIEVPAGDVEHSKVYNGPNLMGDSQDLTPVTISFEDINGDGKADMIMHISGSDSVWTNDGKQFKLSGRSQ